MNCSCHMQVHVILGSGDITTFLPFNRTGVMGDVASSPNDPIFLNHHAMVDCILEEWLQQNPMKFPMVTEPMTILYHSYHCTPIVICLKQQIISGTHVL